MLGSILVLDVGVVILVVLAIVAAIGIAPHLGFFAQAINPGMTEAHIDASLVAQDQNAINEAKGNARIIQMDVMMLLVYSSPARKWTKLLDDHV